MFYYDYNYEQWKHNQYIAPIWWTHIVKHPFLSKLLQKYTIPYANIYFIMSFQI